MDGNGCAWHDSAERIARHEACTFRGPFILSLEDRFDAAMDGIVAYVHCHGWPEDNLHPVFQAASNAIGRATDEQSKHLHWWSYWHEPPGDSDALAESVADRIGARQVTHALTQGEWAAVWALMEAGKVEAGYEVAAAMLGITPAALSTRLSTARQTARRLWVAPGDTPRGQYRASPNGKLHKANGRTYRTNRRERLLSGHVEPPQDQDDPGRASQAAR